MSQSSSDADSSAHTGSTLPPPHAWRPEDTPAYTRANYFLTILPIETWRARIGARRTPSEISLMSSGELYTLEGVDHRAPQPANGGSDAVSSIERNTTARLSGPLDAYPSVEGPPIRATEPATHRHKAFMHQASEPTPRRRGMLRSFLASPTPASCPSFPPVPIACAAPSSARPIRGLRRNYPSPRSHDDSGLERSQPSHPPQQLGTPQSIPSQPPMFPSNSSSPAAPLLISASPDILELIAELRARAETAETRARYFEVVLARTAFQHAKALQGPVALKTVKAKRRRQCNSEEEEVRGRKRSRLSLSPTYVSPAPPSPRPCREVAAMAQSFLARQTAPARVSPGAERRGMEQIARMYLSTAGRTELARMSSANDAAPLAGALRACT